MIKFKIKLYALKKYEKNELLLAKKNVYFNLTIRFTANCGRNFKWYDMDIFY